ncbi:phosphatase PAP2 family protein [Cohnella massiliensis]|uniref:phosphatase PAP2 family protein n=1 Tax=Cohnella massiliensis TaxID=1816691 RepID=UPI0009BA1E8D|nr:phosphatase PAP2 family protein [Cohnella massiliensis]
MKLYRLDASAKREWVISSLLLFVFVFIFARFADELAENGLTRFDLSIIERVQGMTAPELTAIMKVLTSLGSTAAVVLLLLLLVVFLLRQKKRREALFLVVAAGGGGLFNLLLKRTFERPRPDIQRLIEITGYSFPSGHSMIAVIFYGMLGIFCSMYVKSGFLKIFIGGMAIVLILMIGLSRVYLGVHYPSDVIAGFAAGGAWLLICLMGWRTVMNVQFHDRD